MSWTPKSGSVSEGNTTWNASSALGFGVSFLLQILQAYPSNRGLFVCYHQMISLRNCKTFGAQCIWTKLRFQRLPHWMSTQENSSLYVQILTDHVMLCKFPPSMEDSASKARLLTYIIGMNLAVLLVATKEWAGLLSRSRSDPYMLLSHALGSNTGVNRTLPRCKYIPRCKCIQWLPKHPSTSIGFTPPITSYQRQTPHIRGKHWCIPINCTWCWKIPQICSVCCSWCMGTCSPFTCSVNECTMMTVCPHQAPLPSIPP